MLLLLRTFLFLPKLYSQMKILILGSGGREHTLAWKLHQSPKLSKLFVAPGNAGTAAIAKNIQ